MTKKELEKNYCRSAIGDAINEIEIDNFFKTIEKLIAEYGYSDTSATWGEAAELAANDGHKELAIALEAAEGRWFNKG
jgi:SOS-response transcriptional repressor LexA